MCYRFFPSHFNTNSFVVRQVAEAKRKVGRHTKRERETKKKEGKKEGEQGRERAEEVESCHARRNRER